MDEWNNEMHLQNFVPTIEKYSLVSVVFLNLRSNKEGKMHVRTELTQQKTKEREKKETIPFCAGLRHKPIMMQRFHC